MKTKFIFLLPVLFFMVSTSSLAQLGVSTYHTFALGINTSTDKTISGELKAFLNRDFEQVALEVGGYYNWQKKSYHQFSLGLAISALPLDPSFEFFSIPAKLEIFPLQQFKQLSLLIEIAPQVNLESSDLRFRHLWGIRYTFGKE